MAWISGTRRGLDFHGAGGFGCVALALGVLIQAARAEDSSQELKQPPVCSPSPLKPIPPELKGICEIKTRPPADCHPISPGAQCHEIKVNLIAKTGEIEVGGYKVSTTEHYNNSYLTPVIEAMPGDIVAAHLENALDLRETDCAHLMDQGAAHENPTNLHYFHGGIVSPQNDRPKVEDAREGKGDNIYVWLNRGKSFDFNVPIPGAGELDATVLEGKEGTTIPHPNGLNWYHSHLHCISSDQVMGGMSGLLSVGEDKANVKAQCKPNMDSNKCKKDTEELQKRTIVSYTMLRDITLKKINVTPIESTKDKTADWAPEQEHKDFRDECKVWQTINDPPEAGNATLNLRKGFCQRDRNTAWLFTLNGQRFPTITLYGNYNLLLRIGNVSANVAYLLELCDEEAFASDKCSEDGKVLPLTILSRDGVVPAKPVSPDEAKIPVAATDVNDLPLMPASRAEIYVRNDTKLHRNFQTYVLRTKGLDAGTDKWPAIALARIVLEPNSFASPIVVALNAPVEEFLFRPQAIVREEAVQPKGCVRDLVDAKQEYRRVTFLDSEEEGHFKIKTEIVRPPSEPGTLAEDKLEPVDKDCKPDPTNPACTTVGPVAFEDYVQKDGLVDWTKQKHVCVFIDHDAHKGSHKQLWVLRNTTGALHNFHIHQMKFRLATKKEIEDHHIDLNDTPSSVTISGSDIRLYDEQSPPEINPEFKFDWHDTIPIPRNDTRVFLIMSFDAKEQIGRFVYHCHILKHEDKGLMAPIEVWEPTPVLQ